MTIINRVLGFLPLEAGTRLARRFQVILSGTAFLFVRQAFPSRSPCKKFHQKRTLACYKLRRNVKRACFDHYEIYRITNPKEGEFYVFPAATLQKRDKAHLSYHKSGAFHRRESDGKRTIPQDEEADHRNASLISQAVEHVSGLLDGYCLAIGPGTTIESLRIMLKILDGYILFPLKELPTEELHRRRNLMIPFENTPARKAGQELFSRTIAAKTHKIMSYPELEESIRKSAGLDAKIIRFEPRSDRYLCLNGADMKELVSIGHKLAAPKVGEKAPAFWTRTDRPPDGNQRSA